MFGKIDTGDLTAIGTRLWLAASKQDYHTPFNGDFGRISKQHYNFKLYQPVNANGDFVSIAATITRTTTIFFGSNPLRNDTTILSATGAVIGNARRRPRRFGQPLSEQRRRAQLFEPALLQPRRLPPAEPERRDGRDQRDDLLVDLGQQERGVVRGSIYDYRRNPSKTGNIRVNSRFSLTPKLTLTVRSLLRVHRRERRRHAQHLGGHRHRQGRRRLPRLVGGTLYAGKDLNGDGNPNDRVLLLSPSNTVTNRYGVITNLLWNFAPSQTLRLNYTLELRPSPPDRRGGLHHAERLPATLFRTTTMPRTRSATSTATSCRSATASRSPS